MCATSLAGYMTMKVNGRSAKQSVQTSNHANMKLMAKRFISGHYRCFVDTHLLYLKLNVINLPKSIIKPGPNLNFNPKPKPKPGPNTVEKHCFLTIKASVNKM